jgi:hypothetical protein
MIIQAKAYYVGFEVVTAVDVKGSAFLDITPRSPINSTDVSEKHSASIFMVYE